MKNHILQLKSGDIVEVRNGGRYIFVWNAQFSPDTKPKDVFIGIENKDILYLSDYNFDLLDVYGNNEYDIMKVSDKFYFSNIIPSFLGDKYLEPLWIWKREEIEEMTLEEICEELGRNIKIVKEH